MFDPFNDYALAGYLRNKFQEKDPRIIKQVEQEVFIRQLPTAIQYLGSKNLLAYDDFLAVHQILFSEFYPWAGRDRLMTLPNSAVKKGDVLFSHPQSSRLAVEHGLRLGQDVETMAKNPGEIMGLFAYGHPFLDGNGRTMLPVHIELCHRAGFSIAWHKTNKVDYLSALSKEIETPGQGFLDTYLLQFKGPMLDRSAWGADILGMKGLDGLDDVNQIDGDLSDPAVAEKYRKLEERRGYSYEASLTAVQASGLHVGPVVAVEPNRIAQKSGRDPNVVVWHSLDKLQGKVPVVGDMVEINYAHGMGVIKDKSPSQTPERE